MQHSMLTHQQLQQTLPVFHAEASRLLAPPFQARLLQKTPLIALLHPMVKRVKTQLLLVQPLNVFDNPRFPLLQPPDRMLNQAWSVSAKNCKLCSQRLAVTMNRGQNLQCR